MSEGNTIATDGERKELNQETNSEVKEAGTPENSTEKDTADDLEPANDVEEDDKINTRKAGVGADNPDSEKEPVQHESDESEDEGIDNTTEVLDRAARDNLYEKGLQYETKKKNKLALKCFLQCLKGLSGGAEFSYIPQCLRKIADLYFKEDELEKAIQFIQAEKMYYETALIDTTELQKKVEDRQRSQESNPEGQTDPHFSNLDVVRADEFENLAKMCLEKQQAQLALEYQGKATKLRQRVYGDSHEVTKKSLDLFTVIYGEVGKQQYSESMQKLSQAPKAPSDGDGPVEGDEDNLTSPGSPQSILRRRNKEKAGNKRVSFREPDEVREKREQDEFISKAILWVLFFVFLSALVIIFHYIYCKIDYQSNYCITLKSDVQYYYMRLKYLVYYYTTPLDEDSAIG